MTTRTLSAGLLLLALLATGPTPAAEPPKASFEDRFRIARDLALGGKREAALAAYTALLAESPANGDVLVGRGRVHAWMEHWAESEQDLLAATRAAPKDADAWSALGDLYLWSQRPARAVEAYGRWAELAPASGEALAARGRAHRAAGETAAARADFKAAASRGIEADELLASLDVPATQASLSGSRTAEIFIPGQYHWVASLSADRTQFRGANQNWTDAVASLRRQWQGGVSLGLEALESRRFGKTDHAYALDGYFPLWSRAYVNARYQYSPDATLFPGNRYRGELFQGLGSGWELSAGYDRLDFAAAPVELLSVGVGRYMGPFYVRLRYQHVPGTPTTPNGSDSERLVARYYYRGGGDQYLELNADAGQSEPTTTLATPARVARNRRSFGATWAGLVTEHLGARLSLGAGQGLESQPYHHTAVSAALYTRW
jgi:YaiO family outer membrane protein